MPSGTHTKETKQIESLELGLMGYNSHYGLEVMRGDGGVLRKTSIRKRPQVTNTHTHIRVAEPIKCATHHIFMLMEGHWLRKDGTSRHGMGTFG